MVTPPALVGSKLMGFNRNKTILCGVREWRLFGSSASLRCETLIMLQLRDYYPDISLRKRLRRPASPAQIPLRHPSCSARIETKGTEMIGGRLSLHQVLELHTSSACLVLPTRSSLERTRWKGHRDQAHETVSCRNMK